MKFRISFRCSVAFFVYWRSAALLVIVSGQPTTDDVIDDKDQLINKLIDTVAELRAEQQRSAARINTLENLLPASVDKTVKPEGQYNTG